MTDSMDVDMEVDLVLDEEEDEELAQLRAQAEAARASTKETEPVLAFDDAKDLMEEGEVESTDMIPNKVHIQGLDLLTTNDIKNFVSDHYSLEQFKRVEWIDDSSANLVFDDNEAASAALRALSAGEDVALLDGSVQAKQLATHPNADLRVRPSTAQDVKLPGAKDRSRFYLLNPEYDPDLRPRNGKRRPRRDARGADGTKRRRNDDSIYSRRSSREEESFNVNLYDDDGGGEQAVSKHNNNDNKRARKNQDLFLSKDQGRLRDRSASPVADGDGKYGFEQKDPYRRTARRRSFSPSSRREHRSPKRGQELFADTVTSRTDQHDQNGTKELFPSRADGRRSRLHPNQVADIMDKYTFSDTQQSERNKPPSQKRDLFSRITGGPGKFDRNSSTGPVGVLKSDDHDMEGFSILGASKDRPENPLVKELFPLKMQPKSNGQDLFDGRVKGRATQRRRAEDLF